MHVQKTLFTTITACLLVTTNAQAFEVITGEDINQGGKNTHAILENTKRAEQDFRDYLDKTVRTEDFEEVEWDSEPKTLKFLDAGTGITTIATLEGNIEIHDITNAYDLKQGLYAASGTKYLFTEAKSQESNTFTIDFTEDIAAFGFYAYDLGDWGAELTLELYSNGIKEPVAAIEIVPNVETDGSNTGSAIFVGIVGEFLDGAYQTFDQVKFLVTGDNVKKTHHDIFAFDDMTIAKANQLREGEGD